MKFKSCILATFIMAISISCSKPTDETKPIMSDETRTAIISNGVECIDGILHFESAEVCFETMVTLSSESALKEFEKHHKFYSLRSFTDSLFEDLENCKSKAEYDATLDYCWDYIKEEDGCLMPRVTSAGYASIANSDGIFYVNGIKHIVTDEQIFIEDINSNTRSDSAMNSFDYISPTSYSDQTRTETEVRYHDVRYETADYKVFARTNVLRNVVSEVIDGEQKIITSFGVQVHVFGHKDKAIIGWDKYKDRYYVEELHFDLTIGTARVTFMEYQDGYSASEYTRDLYVTIPYGEGVFVGTTAPDMPSRFNCIVHRARSREIGNCGALTDVNCCSSAVILPVSACI